TKKLHQYRIDADLEGADIRKENIELLETNGDYHKNYFYPHCPNGIYDVQEFKKIRIRNIYPGINWVLYLNEKGIKYEFEVGPLSDPQLIKLVYHGARGIALKDGAVTVKCPMGELTEQRPFSFQENTSVD